MTKRAEWQLDGLKLLELLGQIFLVTDDFWQWTDKELAEEAGLSVSTVRRLRSFKHNDWRTIAVGCHSRTLLRLARAVELELYLQEVPKQKRKVA